MGRLARATAFIVLLLSACAGAAAAGDQGARGLAQPGIADEPTSLLQAFTAIDLNKKARALEAVATAEAVAAAADLDDAPSLAQTQVGVVAAPSALEGIHRGEDSACAQEQG
mmetsp:Transcript_107768/g.336076  ORF Transcript_107768/g.336076 Transcript_107768/m.336076 type:complete len:112 (+) Transcript_107768:78-413(+)